EQGAPMIRPRGRARISSRRHWDYSPRGCAAGSARYLFTDRHLQESLMHTHSIEPWQHPHVFLGTKHDRRERRTWFVVALTAAMMVAEITGGTLFGSM